MTSAVTRAAGGPAQAAENRIRQEHREEQRGGLGTKKDEVTCGRDDGGQQDRLGESVFDRTNGAARGTLGKPEQDRRQDEYAERIPNPPAVGNQLPLAGREGAAASKMTVPTADDASGDSSAVPVIAAAKMPRDEKRRSSIRLPPPPTGGLSWRSVFDRKTERGSRHTWQVRAGPASGSACRGHPRSTSGWKPVSIGWPGKCHPGSGSRCRVPLAPAATAKQFR